VKSDTSTGEAKGSAGGDNTHTGGDETHTGGDETHTGGDETHAEGGRALAEEVKAPPKGVDLSKDQKALAEGYFGAQSKYREAYAN
jgi:hypothetical protein